MFSQQVSSDGYIDFYCYNWWFSPNYGDTMFLMYYPINPWKKLQNTTVNGNQGDAYVLAASSFHPGVANFAFVDGSVRFLKDSISTWPFNPVTGASHQRHHRQQWHVCRRPRYAGRLPGALDPQRRRSDQQRCVLSQEVQPAAQQIPYCDLRSNRRVCPPLQEWAKDASRGQT